MGRDTTFFDGGAFVPSDTKLPHAPEQDSRTGRSCGHDTLHTPEVVDHRR